jgi:hypothetical protein
MAINPPPIITRSFISFCSKSVRLVRILSLGTQGISMERGSDPVAMTIYFALYFFVSIAIV